MGVIGFGLGLVLMGEVLVFTYRMLLYPEELHACVLSGLVVNCHFIPLEVFPFPFFSNSSELL